LIVYVDSSLLVSLYVIDTNSPQAVQRMNQHPEVWLTPLNRTELAHAIQQRIFRNQINEFESHRIWTAFEDDCVAGVWGFVTFPEKAWQTSIDLARRHGPTLGMRTLDTVHVACALELGADRFWTFDQRQAQLAAAAGLNTSA
jgi:predicted nucleic acid-binding protein